jgi:hypothetical protein
VIFGTEGMAALIGSAQNVLNAERAKIQKETNMAEPDKADIVARILLILDQGCADPVEMMIAEAEAMLKVAKALKGLSAAEAKATIRAVACII